MKVMLVTGGAGFIGSNYIQYVLNKQTECKVINLDLLTYAGNLENLRNVENNPNYIFIKGNISDEVVLTEIFSNYQIDYVVNFAAESHVDRSIEDPSIFVKTNVVGTMELLNAAKKSWQTGKDINGYPLYREGTKFLQVSTDEVYGALGKEGSFKETTPISPNSPYSASKAGADLLVKSFFETFKMPVNITRCSNNYGPYQFPEKLIPLMISNCLNGKLLPVYGDGMQIRDWLHVYDHCAAIDIVLRKAQNGEVYNIGGNNEKANIEIVKLIIGKLDKTEKLIEYVKDRLGHDQRYAIDNTKIKADLGWEPVYTFENGMEETVNWYLENKSWWGKIVSGKYVEYYEKIYGNR